ncbi:MULTISPECIES: cobalt-precorrin-5B (C(1))-methyltransferase CbiD [Paraclostridium]|uniref:Cobalt-precorrin-5B C(1)-methyltransferase n=1 Tax=Paraclostridium bifermentans TaxID=1490 RepID=A0A5P3XGP3_PARBF|nr:MULTISPECIES: cobalt-precorrin-5B (C(1))-methyltransferase CbiD [Paraclostridium]EQK49284.1 cobalamin biosynthesis protein CbiD [[Clostridium] bifermentans ATCC 19299] [Paraclostridium bifermentans ATCC 19299]MCR1877312.1 cobalt-precorrin-5B (C(1))-methyltransferase CbiD [Paraclostridium bifermentans]QEZ69531.1 cobalt-precorrin-5B (C(1))-methyltransferase [Paraclostridium bifermentans]QEZ69662.1 cobalt-precorrin-5B (C(1))-methyltransferase [Paraclostridium bifermentans]TQO57091.1 cobalt-pre
MEEYVYIDGKKYKRGYTTGSCATGAAKAATYMILTKETLETVNIDTPKGIPLNLKVENVDINNAFAQCSIQKDGGDDIDATHKMHIYAKAELIDCNEIIIDGGIGIGRVTKKGLGIEIGKAAINKTPISMIQSEVRKVIGDTKGVKITIFAPEGETIAKKTFNPRLGIVGGISIIGTTGIVEPMSDEGWKKSLSIELEMKKAQGMDKVILVPGNHGEMFIKESLGIDSKYIVRTSNFIGYMLKEAQRIGFKKILMAGHLGKYVKIAGGIFNTHSKVADARNEILIANLALMNAPFELINKVNECLTTEEFIEILEDDKYKKYKEIYNILSEKCKKRIDIYMNDDEIDIEVMIFSMEKKLLGESKKAGDLKEVFYD